MNQNPQITQYPVNQQGEVHQSPTLQPPVKQMYMEQPASQPRDRSWSTRVKNSLRARWLGYPIIIGLVLTSWAVGAYVHARDRFFVENDPNLSYPYVTDTVPNWSLIFIGALGPLFIIIFTQVMIRRSPRSQYWDKRTKDIHLSIIVLGEVLAATWLITNIIKIYVGRLRPNFYAYCDYKGYRAQVASGNITQYLQDTVPGRIGNFADCALDEIDAHFSFPSGHASITFCGLTYLTLFLIHAISHINFTHHNVGKAIRFFMVLIPLFSGILVASTRVIDYKHHVDDIAWGSIIGMLAAYLAFHANFLYRRPAVPGIRVHGGDIAVTHQHGPFSNTIQPEFNMMPTAPTTNATSTYAYTHTAAPGDAV